MLIPRQRVNFGPCRFELERVDRALPRHDDAVPAQRNLRHDIGAIVILCAHLADLFLQRQFLGNGLQRGKGNGQTGLAAKRAHPAKFIPFAFHVAGHFEHAVPHAAHGAANRDQFFGCGGGSGDQFAVDGLVQNRAAGGETQGSGTNAFLDNARHFGDIIGGGNCARHLTVAQHIGANRAVRNVGGNVNGARQFFQCGQIFGEGFPVPLHPLSECRAGNILNALHQADQPFVAVGARRGKSDTAIAHDNGGNAVPAGRSHFGVPSRLSVIMRVDVNKSGGDDFSARVNFFAALIFDVADAGYQAAIDCDIGGKWLCACAINHCSAANNHVMHLGSPHYQESVSCLSVRLKRD